MLSTTRKGLPAGWLTRPAPVVASEPTTLTAKAAPPNASTKTSAAIAITGRGGPSCTGGDRTSGRGCVRGRVGSTRLAGPRATKLRGVEVASEEAARAPKRHWGFVVLLWVLAGALCALGPDG